MLLAGDGNRVDLREVGQFGETVERELEAIKPMSAVFDQRYVKRLSGPNVKKGKNKKDLADQLIADIRAFKAKNKCERLVMVWAGSG